MPRRIDHVLSDILEAITRIETVTHGKSLQEFSRSWQMRWLVQFGRGPDPRSSVIPGEAEGRNPGPIFPRTQSAMIHGSRIGSRRSPSGMTVERGNELPKLKQAIQSIQRRAAS